jgi:hypothetical protein
MSFLKKIFSDGKTTSKDGFSGPVGKLLSKVCEKIKLKSQICSCPG